MKADHSINKGFPYGGIVSQERFPNRVSPLIDLSTRKIQISPSAEVYPDWKGISWLARLFGGRAIDFLLFRLFDYAEALTVAEDQLKAIIYTEGPFLPEEFSFFKAVKPKDITDNPAVIYISKFDDSISLFRNTEKECEWVIVRNKKGEFTELAVQIPNHRIAYALFYALGIKVEEEKVINSEVFETFKAVYRDPEKEAIMIEGFRSTNDHVIDDACAIISKLLPGEEVNRGYIVAERA